MDLKILAHRGFSSSYPENTMLAFEEAVKAGAHGLELDVQLCKDDRLVVFHDERLDRITNVKGLVKDYTLKELREMDVGSHFNPEFKGLRMPSLEEVLHLVKQEDLFLNIELKNGILPYPGLEEKVIKEIEEFGLREQVVISTFNHQSLLKISKIDSSIKTGVLYFARMVHPASYALSIGASSLHPYYLAIDDHLLEDVREKGLSIITYPVNQLEDMKRMLAYKVDAVITDYPDRLAYLLEEEV